MQRCVGLNQSDAVEGRWFLRLTQADSSRELHLGRHNCWSRSLVYLRTGSPRSVACSSRCTRLEPVVVVPIKGHICARAARWRRVGGLDGGRGLCRRQAQQRAAGPCGFHGGLCRRQPQQRAAGAGAAQGCPKRQHVGGIHPARGEPSPILPRGAWPSGCAADGARAFRRRLLDESRGHKCHSSRLGCLWTSGRWQSRARRAAPSKCGQACNLVPARGTGTLRMRRGEVGWVHGAAAQRYQRVAAPRGAPVRLLARPCVGHAVRASDRHGSARAGAHVRGEHGAAGHTHTHTHTWTFAHAYRAPCACTIQELQADPQRTSARLARLLRVPPSASRPSPKRRLGLVSSKAWPNDAPTKTGTDDVSRVLTNFEEVAVWLRNRSGCLEQQLRSKSHEAPTCTNPWFGEVHPPRCSDTMLGFAHRARGREGEHVPEDARSSRYSENVWRVPVDA